MKNPSVSRWTLLLLVIAWIAAVFGFGLVANMSYTAAKVQFFVFLVLAVLSLLGGTLSKAPPV